MQQKIKGGNQFQLNQIHLGQWPLNSSVHMRVQGWNYRLTAQILIMISQHFNLDIATS